MATNDVKLVEFGLVEKAIWAYQENKLSMSDLLSYNYGAYVLKVLSSPDMHNRINGEVKDSYIKHMIEAIREQEELIPESRYLVGSRTGKVIEAKSQKGTVKLESALETVEAWHGLFETPANKTDNDSANWRNAWRIAHSLATRFISNPEKADKKARELGVSPAMLLFAKDNWQKMSPAMLNKAYQNGKQPAAKNAVEPTIPVIEPTLNGK